MRKDGEPQPQQSDAGQEKPKSWIRSKVVGLAITFGSITTVVAAFAGGSDHASAEDPREGIPTPVFHTATPVPQDTPTPKPTREPIPTSIPHTATPVATFTPTPTSTREAIPSPTPHTPTPVVETPTATPTATGTPRPTETFTPTATFTATATVTGTPIIDYCPNVEGVQDLATVQRLIAQGVRIVNGQCVLPTPEATPTPIIKIITKEIPVGFTRGENLKVLSVEVHPQLAKESNVAGIDILRNGVPLFGADVREAPPIIGNIEWNGEVIKAGIETYDIPEELDVVGQIDTGDPNKILIPGHSSLFRLQHLGAPVFSRLDEVQVGDTVATFVNGESIPYNVIFAGKVTDLDAALNSYNGGKYVFLVTCPKGFAPGAEKYLVVAVAPKKEAPAVEIPFIGEVPTAVAVAAGGAALAGALALGASGALGIGAGAALRKREESDTHEVPLNKIGL